MSMKEIQRKKEEIVQNLMSETKTNSLNNFKFEKQEDVMKSEKFKVDLKSWLESEIKEPFLLKEKQKSFRKYVYDTLRRDYPELLYKTITNDNSMEKEILIFKPNIENNQVSFMVKKKQHMEEQLLASIGFTSVIELLIDSKKKLVGHNCYLDLLFLYSHFIDFVPKNYLEFKAKLNELFPRYKSDFYLLFYFL